MVQTCYFCNEKARKGGPSFHYFPKDENLKKEWLKAMRLEGVTPCKSAILCGKHFLHSDFVFKFALKTLKSNAVPSIFDFSRGRKRKLFPISNEDSIAKNENTGKADAQKNLTGIDDTTSTSFSPVGPVLNFKGSEVPNLCRVCLSKGTIVNILDSQYESIPMKRIFKTLFQTEIKENDEKELLNLCAECLESILNFYDIFEKYKKTQRVLKYVQQIILTSKARTNANIDLDINVDYEAVNQFEIKQEKAGLVSTFSKNVSLEHSYHVTEKKASKNETLYVCRLCDYNGRVQAPRVPIAGLRRHYFRRHLLYINNYTLNCVKCNEEFPSLDELVQHTFGDQHQNKECPMCKKTFNSLTLHYRHVKNKLCEDHSHSCLLCDVNLDTFKEVIEHFKENHFRRDEKCMLCHKTCKSMTVHLMSHRPTKMQFACIMCMETFENEQDFAEHKLQTDHSKTSCKLCGQLVNRRAFNAHWEKHKGSAEEKIMCNICNKVFTCKSYLKKHLEIIHQGKRYYCDKCPARYTTLWMLKGHITRVHEKKTTRIVNSKPKRTQTIMCELCGKKVSKYKKKDMVLHKAYHEVGHKFICRIADCLQTFYDVEARKWHMESEHENFTCSLCQRTYFNSEKFNTHRYWHIWKSKFIEENEDEDKDKKEIICYICNEQFYSYKLLSKHLKAKYGIFMCTKDSCNKIFAGYVSYKAHSDLHGSGSIKKKTLVVKLRSSIFVQPRPFSCNICRRKFRKSQQLKIHSRIHTGERPFECRYCNKTFPYESSLKGHERLHTGEKPFSCRYCGQRYSDSGYVKKHEVRCVRNQIV